MDFDENGMPSIESLILLEELVRDAERANTAHEHNMQRSEIADLGMKILEHCMEKISADRELLAQEGALNSAITSFLCREGNTVRKADSHGNDYLHYMRDGKRIAERTESVREKSDINSDIITGKNNNRVELKTAAFATAKDKVVPEFFSKDLDYLRRKPFTSMDDFPWEGMLRKDRSAEMAILAADKNIAVHSQKLMALVGDISSDEHIIRPLHDGVTYIIRTGIYKNDQVLHVQRDNPLKIEKFIVLLALPSVRE